MYHMTGGSKQSFAPFDYPTHIYQTSNHISPFGSHYFQPYYPQQMPPYPASHPQSFTPLSAKHNRPPIMNAFLKQDGSFDFEKTFQTVHQISNTFQQVSPLMKQVGSLFKIGKL